MVNQAEKRRIALQNLSKVKQKTGRKKKIGIKRTYRYDLGVDSEIRKMAEDKNMKPYFLINTVLLAYLVEQKYIQKQFAFLSTNF